MAKTFQILIKTINNEPLEQPQNFFIDCGRISSVGFQIQRVYDETDCIVARNVVTFMYGREMMGTQQFLTVDSFYQYVAAQCQCCPPPYCFFTINGCIALINGCPAWYTKNF